MVTVSHWYEEMFQNWFFWYKNLNLEMETILIAEDPIIYKKYMNSTEFMTINYSVKKVSRLILGDLILKGLKIGSVELSFRSEQNPFM